MNQTPLLPPDMGDLRGLRARTEESPLFCHYDAQSKNLPFLSGIIISGDIPRSSIPSSCLFCKQHAI